MPLNPRLCVDGKPYDKAMAQPLAPRDPDAASALDVQALLRAKVQPAAKHGGKRGQGDNVTLKPKSRGTNSADTTPSPPRNSPRKGLPALKYRGVPEGLEIQTAARGSGGSSKAQLDRTAASRDGYKVKVSKFWSCGFRRAETGSNSKKSSVDA